jgi:hypothetical protein
MAFRSAFLLCLLSFHSLVFIFIIHQVILVLLWHKSMFLTCPMLLNMNHPFEKKLFRVEWFSVKTFYEKGWVLDISGIMWCHAFLSTFHFINPHFYQLGSSFRNTILADQLAYRDWQNKPTKVSWWPLLEMNLHTACCMVHGAHVRLDWYI